MNVPLKGNWKINKKQPPEVFCKKSVLRNFAKFTGKHLCQSLYFKIEALAQVFSCEFCEISKNTFSYRTPLVAASVKSIFNTVLITLLLEGRNLKQPDLKRKAHKFKSLRLPKQSFSIQQLSKGTLK